MGEDTLVTALQAGRLVGKSQDTIKRWVKAGRLTAERQGEGANAPMLVRQRDVLLLVAGHADAPTHASQVVTMQRGADPPGMLGAVQAHLADAIRQRDAAQSEAAELRGRMMDLERRCATLDALLRVSGGKAVRALLEAGTAELVAEPAAAGVKRRKKGKKKHRKR